MTKANGRDGCLGRCLVSDGACRPRWPRVREPILLYDGQHFDIVPDFLVGQRLSEELPPQGAFAAAPVLPALRKVFPALETFIGTAPVARPAPKVWVQDGDALVEYIYYPNGVIGFELIRETAKVVSTSPDKAGIDADAATRP